jgi:hypothetical protein
MSLSKSSVLAWMECDLVKMVSFSMSEIRHGQNCLLEFKFVYIFSLRQAIHGLQTKETDDTCNLSIKSLSSGPQVTVKVAQERWQAIDNKKL